MGSKILEIYNQNVFDKKKMFDFLSISTINALEKWIEDEVEINESQAEEIANAIKNWAISMGATHYTHWFQPLNGRSAEKHNSFLSLDKKSNAIEKLNSSSLISAEADASSFPNGGLRSTFEARGYVVWDASSPVFIWDDNGVKTLCIPSIFITYNGESIDQKLPLLKSKAILSEKCKELLAFFDRHPKEVFATAGLEQEYFLVEKDKYLKRDDLKMLGRTLFSIKPPKTQQMQDQYLGTIRSKILHYMDDVQQEAYKYGIPLATRHNEVAPNQYEFAPIFEEANIANDHNQLTMNIMNMVAEKHNLACLFNEKPFHSVNGSGKHLNWSLCDSDGNNLLQPSEDAEKNLQFLTFIVVVIQAVHDHSDLLISSVAFSNNDARLGGHEAPPSILSVFLGQLLDKILNLIEKNDNPILELQSKIFSNFKKMPIFFRDNTDRNRTSPFAFTGNKFEFRAVGSSQNVAFPITVFNTIVADSIDKTILTIKKYLKNNSDFNIAILKTLKDIIIRTKNIRFEKDGYSKSWQEEARKRGLYSTNNVFKSLQRLTVKENVELFEKYGVLTEIELNSRFFAWSNLYITSKKIEMNVMLELIDSKIIPNVLEYRTFLLENLKATKGFVEPSLLKSEKKLLKSYSKLVNSLFEKKEELLNVKDKFKNIKQEVQIIDYITGTVKPLIEEMKEILEELEKKTGDKYWDSVKYKDLLFY